MSFWPENAEPSWQEISGVPAQHLPCAVRSLVFSGPWSALCWHAAPNVNETGRLMEIYKSQIDLMEFLRSILDYILLKCCSLS